MSVFAAQDIWHACTKHLYKRGFVHIYIHTYAHFSLLLQIQEVLHYGDFVKLLYRRGFAMGVLYTHTYTKMHILSLFFSLQMWVMLHYGGFESPSRRSFAVGLHRASIQRGFIHIYTHKYAHFNLFLQILGKLYHRGFTKPLYRRGFTMGTL